MTMEEFRDTHHAGLFASRDSLVEALNYGADLISTLPSEHRIVAFTAMYVAVNAALDEAVKHALKEM